MGVEIRPYTVGDIAQAALHLRAADVEEVRLSHGASAYDAIRHSVILTERPFTIHVEDRPLAVFGVARVSEDVGTIWLLGTESIVAWPLSFARASKRFLPELTEGFRRVENMVWAEYTVALRWLRWLGFTVDAPERWGSDPALFCRVWKEI